MEVVVGEPARIGIEGAIGSNIRQVSEAAGAFEHEVDHRLVDTEVAQHDDRQAAVDRLQGSCRGDRDQAARTAQRRSHGSGDESYGV